MNNYSFNLHNRFKIPVIKLFDWVVVAGAFVDALVVVAFLIVVVAGPFVVVFVVGFVTVDMVLVEVLTVVVTFVEDVEALTVVVIFVVVWTLLVDAFVEEFVLTLKKMNLNL